MINNEYCTLSQVYAFILERPGVNRKSQRDLLFEYFSSLHQGCSSRFEIDRKYMIKGFFGKYTVIDASSAPKFINKEHFIEWVYAQINR